MLALRGVETTSLEEASLEYRAGLPHPTLSPHPAFTPFCTALRWRSQPKSGDYAEASKVLHQQRGCDSFVEWVPGFSPKDHHEMLSRRDMLAREDARDDAQKAWQRELQKDLEETAERRHRDLQETAEARHREQEEGQTTRHDDQEGRATRRHRQDLLVFGAVIGGLIIAAAVIEVIFGGGADVTVILR